MSLYNDLGSSTPWDKPRRFWMAATATFGFFFRDIRGDHTRFISWLMFSEMIRPLAPLIRLFFSTLIASLQRRNRVTTSLWPVMIHARRIRPAWKDAMLAESIKTLRFICGKTSPSSRQTIPALDENLLRELPAFTSKEVRG